jgi:hypothetical protein
MRNISNILGLVVKLGNVNAKNYSRIALTKTAFKKKKKMMIMMIKKRKMMMMMKKKKLMMMMMMMK